MPKPASVPTWATDANFTNGPTGIPGTATKVEPTAGQKAEGWIPKNKVAAQWLNWFKNAVGGWLVYLNTWFNGSDELVYPVTKTRTVRFSPWLAFTNNAATASEDAGLLQVFSTPPNEGWNLVSRHDFMQSILPLSDLLPEGAVIDMVRAIVKPGAARAVMTTDPGDNGRMFLSLFAHTLNWTAGPPPTSAFTGPTNADEDDGTTDIQILSTGSGLALTVAKATAQRSARIVCGDDAGTNRDRILGWEVTFTQPGPSHWT